MLLQAAVDDRIQDGVLNFGELKDRDAIAKQLVKLGFDVRRSTTRQVHSCNMEHLTDPTAPKWLYIKVYKLKFRRAHNGKGRMDCW